MNKTALRVFLFTRGQGGTASDEADIAMLAKNIQKANIKVNVVCFGFMDDYDIENNRLGDHKKDPEEEKNALLLVMLKESAPDNVQVLTGEVAVQLYREFRKPDKSSRPLFRDDLQIGNLSLAVGVYKYVRENKLKSLKKASAKAEQTSDEKQGLVASDTVFYKQDDAAMAPVEAEHQAKGFQYGKNIVPISALMEDGMKIYEEKGMRLLGFVESRKIPRQSFMSGIDIVVPTDSPRDRKLFSALLFAMLSTKKYALVRYVARKNSRGVSPKLMALIPYKSVKGEYFYLTELPTAEDVREYQFSSLRESSPRQRDVVGRLIDSLNLIELDEEGEPQETLRVKHMINPTRQYFFQSVFHRAMGEGEDLPPVDPHIHEYLHPEQALRQRAAPLVPELAQEFKFAVKATEPKKNLLVLRDLIERTEKVSEADSAETAESLAMMGKAKLFVDEPVLRELPFHDPLPTFRKMVTERSEDLVEPALRQLQAIIRKAAESGLEEQLQRAVEWTAELRAAAQLEQEHQLFDGWLKETSQQFSGKDFWTRLQRAGIGFIKADNRELFAAPAVLTKVQEELDVEELD